MTVPRTIGHVVLSVSDVERSIQFYRDVVGFQLAGYRPGGPGAFLTCGRVHHNLALFQAPADAQPIQQNQIGLHHFAFEVDDYPTLQAAHQRLVAAGVTIDSIVSHGLTRSVYFLDPDGIRMELFSNAFASDEEGLAFMRATAGMVAPLDISAPEPPAPPIPASDLAEVK